MTKKDLKRYAISSALTFISGFALVVVPSIDTLTMDSFRDGTLVGLLFVGTRTGLKMMLEGIVSWYEEWQQRK